MRRSRITLPVGRLLGHFAMIGLPAASSLSAQAPADTIRGRVDLVIGEEAVAAPGRSAGKHVFSAVSGVAVDRQGRIYASDVMQTHVVVFSPDGSRLATIGRKGQGPGEFEGPSGLALCPDGTLYVRDVSHGIAHFVIDPSTGLATKHDRDFRGPLYPNWMSRRASRVDRQGRFHHPGSQWRTGELVRHWYTRYDAQGQLLDTLHVPRYSNEPEPTASIRTSPNGGRMVRGLNHVPFAAIPVWDVTGEGTLISGDAKSYALTETDAAGTVIRRFERNQTPARIPAGERADSARALARRIDSLPIPIERVSGASDDVKTQRLPATYPAYMAVFWAEDGRVWVRRWPTAPRSPESVFDVFDASARFLGTVAIPVHLAAGHHPVIRSDFLVGVTIDPDTDLESIVRVRFRSP